MYSWYILLCGAAPEPPLGWNITGPYHAPRQRSWVSSPRNHHYSVARAAVDRSALLWWSTKVKLSHSRAQSNSLTHWCSLLWGVARAMAYIIERTFEGDLTDEVLKGENEFVVHISDCKVRDWWYLVKCFELLFLFHAIQNTGKLSGGVLCCERTCRKIWKVSQ